MAYKEIPDETQTIPIEDIGVVLLESQQVSITIPLLNALAENNCQVVLCDRSGMPASTLTSLDSNNTQGEILRNQMACGEVLKKQLWKQIVEAKIFNQSRLLDKIGQDGEILKPLYSNVKSGDSDNKEGIAAKMYFPLIFGRGFVRNRDASDINILLNYGYTILRAAVARSLVASGLFPAIGIFHHNRSNAFPLADDIMEPYRPYVDEIVYELVSSGEVKLNKETKSKLIMLLYADTHFKNTKKPLSIGLSMTTASLVKCFAKEITKLSLPVLK